ncbi:MAG: imelysin family protein [Saprospiraceae bacterium]|nr:peptidase M75 [Lewinella sp.]
MNHPIFTIRTFLFTLLAISLLACNKNDDDTFTPDYAAVFENYAEIVYASYEDSYAAAEALKTAIDDFVANPTATGLENAKTRWLEARVPYGQTEAYRFYGGPIDDEDGPEGLINAWPIDENFIDYVAGNATAGLINDPLNYPEISKTVLEDLNESISETSIYTGYHAIEFLLWGQDLSTSGPGERPYTDYVTDGSGTAAYQDRRALYLQVVTDLLLDHLALVRDEWATGGAYRSTFLATDEDAVLGYLFTALGELSKGELAGERMFVAVDSEDQENEHSCFSDNTDVDILMNFQGIWNVYYGSYTRIDGSTVNGESLSSVAGRIDQTKADAVDVAFETAAAAIDLIPDPFDQAILNNQDVILDAVEALRDLSDRLTDVGFALGAEF